MTHTMLALSAVGLLAAIYQPTTRSIIASWSSNPLAHGYLVGPAVAYLAWTRRDQLRRTPLAPSFPLLIVLACAAALWLFGDLAAADIITQIALIAMIPGFIWGMFGAAAFRAALFPLGLLMFALPIAQPLVPTLQDWAARFAVRMLSLTGVPVLLQGNVISIPGASWQVAEACSGINYLTSSAALGYLYAGLVYHRWRNRLGFVAASILVPLIGNGIRVYFTILLASLGATRIVAGMSHYLFGWFVFAAMTAILLLLCGRWDDTRSEPPAPGSTSQRASPRRHMAASLLFMGVGLVVVAAAPLLGRAYRTDNGHSQPVALVPSIDPAWVASAPDPIVWRPQARAADGGFAGVYTAAGLAPVKLAIAYYAPDAIRSLTSIDAALVAEPWRLNRDGRRPVTRNGEVWTVREIQVSSGGRSVILWSWYDVEGRRTTSYYLAKLLLARARLAGRARGASLIVIATEDVGAGAETALTQFVEHLSAIEVEPSQREMPGGRPAQRP